MTPKTYQVAEPTAVGDVSSAVAVPVASRRWLSFPRQASHHAMKTILPLFASALFFFCAFGLAAAETNAEAVINFHEKEITVAMRSFVEARGQIWMTNYYGKTLSSPGELDTIRIIDHTTRTTPNWTHRDLWRIIEESKVQDYPKRSVPFWVPPVFTIKCSSGSL